MAIFTTVIRHWLPIITFCPVNRLPDFIYVSVIFEDGRDNALHELYAIRKKIRRLISWKMGYMETFASLLFYHFPECKAVEIRLAFSRHVVRVENMSFGSVVEINEEKKSA